MIWVRSRICGCLVTWFCYHLIAKPGNKTAAFVTWPIYIWLHDKCPCSKLYHKNSDKKPGFCFTKVADPKVWKIIPFSFNSNTKMYINVWNFMLIGHIYIFWIMYTHIFFIQYLLYYVLILRADALWYRSVVSGSVRWRAWIDCYTITLLSWRQ